MIKVFIDTEFTRLPIPIEWNPDPTNYIPLISLGMVDESGTKTFYAELQDGWDQKDCSEFTMQTVLPLLEGGPAMISREQLISDLQYWLSSFNDRVVFYCDYIVDWYFVRNLLKDQPIEIDYELVRYWAQDEQIAYEWMLNNFFDPVTRPRHHSLNDAMGLRETWMSLHLPIE